MISDDYVSLNIHFSSLLGGYNINIRHGLRDSEQELTEIPMKGKILSVVAVEVVSKQTQMLVNRIILRSGSSINCISMIRSVIKWILFKDSN